MAQHDYIIDNQSAPASRADLNSALSAIVTQNAGASAPATTYADMFWYDTSTNQLNKRNEANSAWITLGTINESTSKFTPNSALTTAGIDPATLVVASEGIASNNNDTTIPTCAAVKAYADSVGSPLLVAPTAGATLIQRISPSGQSISLGSASSSGSFSGSFAVSWISAAGCYTALQAGSVRIQGVFSSATTGSLTSPAMRIYKEAVLQTTVTGSFSVDISLAAGETLHFGAEGNYSWGSSGGSASMSVTSLAIYANSRTIWSNS